ncbi:MAG TPA: RNA-guided pseudouridylation complex pseudouridine synthase subunit Cbf5 [Candidatus Nanoarchaeia archaeon]|nr:RNA-guided pseudouridylation complex pseudouridine synthase subunit Cbf5 [Candidatus Nanoarchaeia archaeon]
MLPFQEAKRELIAKRESEISEYGRRPEDRTTGEIINFGIVNVDKPKGPTSHQVADYVKKILHITKAGHSGTLDPGVTGVLPVALGNATRIVQAILPAGKEYVCVMHLHKDVDLGTIKQEFSAWTGKIMQKPPLKSSVKRVLRPRTIYYLELLEADEKDMLFRIGCEAGTYIRKFCHDFGQKLGVGAHMAELRRTRAGPFDESTLFTLQDLTDAYYYYSEGNDKFLRKVIQPIESGVAHLPKIYAVDGAINSLAHGRNLALPGVAKYESNINKGQMVAIFSLKNELVCLGTSLMSSEEMAHEKGLAVQVERVFMKPGVYPRITY